MTNTSWIETADLAAGRGALGIGMVVAAAVVVALLIGAFAFGSRRVRQAGRVRPRPEEQPRMPEGGPVREVRENREPDEMPTGEGRLTPHEMPGRGSSGTGAAQERPRWDEGSSGGFGSGGPGAR
ncbi:hypothetical protein HCJ93_18820 [Streptomyces sp. SBST2-5]|uniref:Secreted protein n=1 Tax=Streptomyces composti TaxID=2720025 RepID=A0ABX1ABQ0_9ACTN|nr:DUF6479 family protein [Streptomyces composti]NJP52044.1 hypothetical protein [Streptomyces composti]